MNEHQQRIWQSMIELIQSHLNGEIDDFYDIVVKLEEALDASDIQDNTLINQWYNFWTPLEIRRAVEENNVNKTKAIEELTIMKEFLLSKQEAKP
jgi:hypothetical protein